jgi:hypothetical protein
MTAEPAPSVSPPTVGRGRRTASVGIQLVGVIGFAVCVILAVLVLLGRGWAVDQVDAVATSVDDGIAKGLPLLAAADQRVGEVTTQVQRVSDLAGAVATTDRPATDAGQALSAGLSGISERYLPLRAGYADARANLLSAVDRLEAASRFLPGVSVPQGPVDALSRLDEAIRAMDERVVTLLGANASGTPVKDAATRVSTASARVLDGLGEVSTRLGEAETRLDEARAKAASTMDTITTLVNVVAVILVLLLVYVAILHLVLFRSAGGMRQSPRA